MGNQLAGHYVQTVSDRYLEHGQEQVLLSALVLVPIDCEHDRLEKGIDLCH